jgi:hypothetical protein
MQDNLSMNSIMSLKDNVLKILKSNETRRINFSFTGDDGTTDVSVNYVAFQKVVAAIGDGSITFGDASTLPSGSDGGYFGGSNTFTINESMHYSRLFNALVIHESVHAYFDLLSLRLLGIDSEAAGYIAQGYYLKNAGYTRAIPDRLVSLGRECVNTSAAVPSHVNVNKLTELRSELENSPLYSGILFINPAAGFDPSNRAYFQGNG